MDESAKAAHGQIERVSDKEYQGEKDPSEAKTAVADSHRRDVVESFPQHASGEAKGIETKVAEHVAVL